MPARDSLGAMKYEDTLMRPEVRRFYYRRLREMTIEQKIHMVSQLRERAKALARAGVELQHPELSADEVEHEVRRRMERPPSRTSCNH